jgi:IS1 family transposase
MRRLPTDKRVSILAALVEGNSVNSTARLCGVSKVTVLRLLADAGTVCARLHDRYVRGLDPESVELDELWAFVQAKDKNLAPERKGDDAWGSQWTWVALDADSKLVIAYYVGQRDDETAYQFLCDVRNRVEGEPQITSDAFKYYARAVRDAFGPKIPYAQLHKDYRRADRPDYKYSPPKVVGVKRIPVTGDPDPAKVSTSFVERHNLTTRMGCRRYTRLTNAHSKKLENHRHATTIQFWHYNWVRKHATLKTTPAVAAGIANKPWTLLDLVNHLESEEAAKGARITDYLPAVSK